MTSLCSKVVTQLRCEAAKEKNIVDSMMEHQRRRIDFHEHIAGSLNVWADALSRLHQPGGGHVVPPELLQRPRAIPLVRNAGWWETAESLVAPVGSSLLSS